MLKYIYKDVIKMILYHASNEVVEYPEVRISQYTKDFSWGFYCTVMHEQAVRWAKRRNGKIINIYEYKENSNLKIKKFDSMSDEWLDFIVDCRNGLTHDYDIVEGPFVYDTIWNYLSDYIDGEITREQFWSLAKFKYPTHQISFHTLKAIECLTFIRSEIVDE